MPAQRHGTVGPGSGVVRPDHQVGRARPDLMIAAGTPVCLRGVLSGHRADDPASVRLRLRAGMAGAERSGGTQVLARPPLHGPPQHVRVSRPSIVR
ncbi:hypothetical protein SDC9_60228 [bioreactor metagenome]|uniref:Uncharacterized protein n=1 Tax=bioreactor metagenome TaxID=1076179 RepID=A0A644XDM6_9ZZZZ